MTLIADNDIFALCAVVFGLAWLGFWADGNKLGKKTSGALWVIVGGIALSNLHVTPFQSPVYDVVGGYLVPLGIPLLLFKADLRKIFKESGGVMITFMVASIGTMTGAVVGFYAIDLGDIGPKAAGVYTGGFIGGSMNFVAVSQAVGMTPSEFSVALGANSVVSVMALMTLVTLPSLAVIRRMVPSPIMDNMNAGDGDKAHEQEGKKMRLTHISGALALSFIICTAAYHAAEALGISQYSILFVTTLAVLVANIFPAAMDKLEGEFDTGMLIMYTFFAAVGLGTNVTTFIESALNLFVYSILIVVVHLLVVLLVARLLKVDLAEALVASAAALVGPAPTAAIAISQGWRTLVTPGIMCGIFGYVIANFIGVTITKLLS